MKTRLNKKRGFTLVELLVVLVILAILAAILIPSLIRYIDKARQSRILGEARSVLTAASTKIEEYYGEGAIVIDSNGSIDSSSISGETFYEEIKKEANVPDDSRVSNVSYYPETFNLHTVTYERDSYAASFTADEDGASGKWDLSKK